MSFGALIVQTQLGQLSDPSEPQSSHPDNESTTTAVLARSVTLCTVLIKELCGTEGKVQARRCLSACPSEPWCLGGPPMLLVLVKSPRLLPLRDGQRTGNSFAGVVFWEDMVNGIPHEYILMEV